MISNYFGLSQFIIGIIRESVFVKDSSTPHRFKFPSGSVEKCIVNTSFNPFSFNVFKNYTY